MWDKQSIITLIVALSTVPPLASCGNEQQHSATTRLSREDSEHEHLWKQFQQAHTLKGIEGIEARANAYEAIGNYELAQCERLRATTGTLDQSLYNDALNCFRQSRIIAGERSSTLTGLARANYIAEEYFEAGILAQQALALDENNAQARLLKINSFIARNRTENSIPDIEWYLSHEPGNNPENHYNEEFRELVVKTYLERGKVKKAKEQARILHEEHVRNEFAVKLLYTTELVPEKYVEYLPKEKEED